MQELLLALGVLSSPDGHPYLLRVSDLARVNLASCLLLTRRIAPVEQEAFGATGGTVLPALDSCDPFSHLSALCQMVSKRLGHGIRPLPITPTSHRASHTEAFISGHDSQL